MAALIPFKGLQIVSPDPTGAGGLAIHNNFKELADRAGPVTTKEFDPLITDDDVGTAGNGTFFQFSKWWNSVTSTMFFCGDASTGAAIWIKIVASASQAAVQARRTTTFTVLSAFTDINFDTTDKENAPTILDHDAGNTDDIINQNSISREVEITYQFGVEHATTDPISARLRINDTTVIPGSLKSLGGTFHNQSHELSINHTVFATLAAGEKVTLQIDGDASPNTIIKAGALLLVKTID